MPVPKPNGVNVEAHIGSQSFRFSKKLDSKKVSSQSPRYEIRRKYRKSACSLFLSLLLSPLGYKKVRNPVWWGGIFGAILGLLFSD